MRTDLTQPEFGPLYPTWI